MIFLPLYALIAPLLGFSREYTNIVPRLWSSLVFWLTIMGLPILLLIRDFAWKSFVFFFHAVWCDVVADPASRYKQCFTPEPYHIVQEIQKFNLPDYRPRQTQFQKVRSSPPLTVLALSGMTKLTNESLTQAIKKVRAVQRLRKNRGFAFSQTEDLKQERLIRSYDTTKAKLAG